jgi:endonuclease-8
LIPKHIRTHMPEGPSIVILKELIAEVELIGKEIIEVSGNTKIDKERMLNKRVRDFKSWGKHFLICFDSFALRIHFMLFGTYRINERKESTPRLSLKFDDAELNFYTCSLQFIEGDLNHTYDWSADVMSDTWNPASAILKLGSMPNAFACDALLDQNVFAGVGNIIKNEVLFRICVHPLSKIGQIPHEKLSALVDEARHYSFDFLKWKKEYTLKAHWLAHAKKVCPRCDIPFHKAHLGKTNRRSFFCTNCQVLYLQA